MERKFEEALQELKKLLLEMAARVEENIRDALLGVENGDIRLLEDVTRRDAAIDLAEIRIDEHCLSLLALQQPVARDLRFITTALKIVKDIERIGDMARNIAKHGIILLEAGMVTLPPDFRKIGAASQEMLRKALDSFVGYDAAMARQVILDDDTVDELHRKLIAETTKRMIDDPNKIEVLTHLIAVGKFLERIGDHSSNIAEMVVFMVEAKDIRHKQKIQGLEVDKP